MNDFDDDCQCLDPETYVYVEDFSAARARPLTGPGYRIPADRYGRSWVYRSVPTGVPDDMEAYTRSFRRRLLDSGHEIDPSSLRLQGTRLSWIHSGKRRYAELE